MSKHTHTQIKDYNQPGNIVQVCVYWWRCSNCRFTFCFVFITNKKKTTIIKNDWYMQWCTISVYDLCLSAKKAWVCKWWESRDFLWSVLLLVKANLNVTMTAKQGKYCMCSKAVEYSVTLWCKNRSFKQHRLCFDIFYLELTTKIKQQ